MISNPASVTEVTSCSELPNVVKVAPIAAAKPDNSSTLKPIDTELSTKPDTATDPVPKAAVSTPTTSAASERSRFLLERNAEQVTRKLINELAAMSKNSLKQMINNPGGKYATALMNHARQKLRAEVRRQLKDLAASGRPPQETGDVRPDEAIDANQIPSALLQQIGHVLDFDFFNLNAHGQETIDDEPVVPMDASNSINEEQKATFLLDNNKQPKTIEQSNDGDHLKSSTPADANIVVPRNNENRPKTKEIPKTPTTLPKGDQSAAEKKSPVGRTPHLDAKRQNTKTPTTTSSAAPRDALKRNENGTASSSRKRTRIPSPDNGNPPSLGLSVTGTYAATPETEELRTKSPTPVPITCVTPKGHGRARNNSSNRCGDSLGTVRRAITKTKPNLARRTKHEQHKPTPDRELRTKSPTPVAIGTGLPMRSDNAYHSPNNTRAHKNANRFSRRRFPGRRSDSVEHDRYPRQPLGLDDPRTKSPTPAGIGSPSSRQLDVAIGDQYASEGGFQLTYEYEDTEKRFRGKPRLPWIVKPADIKAYHQNKVANAATSDATLENTVPQNDPSPSKDTRSSSASVDALSAKICDRSEPRKLSVPHSKDAFKKKVGDLLSKYNYTTSHRLPSKEVENASLNEAHVCLPVDVTSAMPKAKSDVRSEQRGDVSVTEKDVLGTNNVAEMLVERLDSPHATTLADASVDKDNLAPQQETGSLSAVHGNPSEKENRKFGKNKKRYKRVKDTSAKELEPPSSKRGIAATKKVSKQPDKQVARNEPHQSVTIDAPVLQHETIRNGQVHNLPPLTPSAEWNSPTSAASVQNNLEDNLTAQEESEPHTGETINVSEKETEHADKRNPVVENLNQRDQADHGPEQNARYNLGRESTENSNEPCSQAKKANLPPGDAPAEDTQDLSPTREHTHVRETPRRFHTDSSTNHVFNSAPQCTSSREVTSGATIPTTASCNETVPAIPPSPQPVAKAASLLPRELAQTLATLMDKLQSCDLESMMLLQRKIEIDAAIMKLDSERMTIDERLVVLQNERDGQMNVLRVGLLGSQSSRGGSERNGSTENEMQPTPESCGMKPHPSSPPSTISFTPSPTLQYGGDGGIRLTPLIVCQPTIVLDNDAGQTGGTDTSGQHAGCGVQERTIRRITPISGNNELMQIFLRRRLLSEKSSDDNQSNGDGVLIEQ
ncbi:uncharacterized protein LOC128270958 [Anopheles cruzii]|uniref:uncharacterized protein LOC128270958 n=1 Tax=Anopheles cruzii TaxID=68878 RepID=UPI0022EC4E1F|nr:uncharacterized protein LOC128270958 [Anopheles cruzii]